MIPSRDMPPRNVGSEGPGIVLWALLLGFAGFGVWGLGQAWLHTPVFGAALTGIILLGLWEMRRDSRRRERFVRQRATETTGDEICRFARNFDRRTIDPWVVRAVYEELADWMSEPDAPFAPRATDHLFRDLRLDEDDLDLDMVPAICARRQIA